jgi:hypothetical protein
VRKSRQKAKKSIKISDVARHCFFAAYRHQIVPKVSAHKFHLLKINSTVPQNAPEIKQNEVKPGIRYSFAVGPEGNAGLKALL